MDRVQLKTNAKEVLRGKIFISFLVILVVGIIVGLPSTIFSGQRASTTTVGSILTIIVGIFLIPMENGIFLYFYNMAQGLGEKFSDILTPYKNGAMWELIKAKIVSGFFIFLGFICLIIPGIYLALKYAMIDYVFVENPKLTYREAMKISGELMDGQKLNLLVLGLSFLGWILLSALTLGILFIYVLPYMKATFMQFYLSIRKIESLAEPADEPLR
jgi:uncharacterized membrane protein